MPSPHWQLNDAEWLRREYLERGRTGKDLAGEIGVHPNTLARALERHGVRKPAHRAAAAIPKRWLHDQHVRRGRSIRDIAVEVGVAPTSIRRALEAAGIPVDDRRLPAELDDPAWMAARQHLDRKALAEQLGVSVGAVSRARRRLGLRTGSPSPFPQLDDRAWLEERYHGRGMTQQAIADEVGCARSAVAQAMSRLGVSARRRQVRYPRLHEPAWLAAQVEAGRSPAQIAAEVGCYRTTVVAAMRRYGLR